MAKGMSLDEFKDALASDARVENEKLKKDIKHLKETTSKQIYQMYLNIRNFS